MMVNRKIANKLRKTCSGHRKRVSFKWLIVSAGALRSCDHLKEKDELDITTGKCIGNNLLTFIYALWQLISSTMLKYVLCCFPLEERRIDSAGPWKNWLK